MDDANEPEVYVVAGCLFEVTLPEREGERWDWTGDQPEVTALGEAVRDGRRYFRFRPEAAAADAGRVVLRFRSETKQRGMTTRMVTVPVAPEAQGDE